jgi:hypothetical protein
MRIAYCSLDEVNTSLAETLADRFGDTLCPRWPKDGPPDGEFDAVIYDLDAWPAGDAARVVRELSQAPPTCPVAVCTYNLEEDRAKALSGRGVVVCQVLTEAVFKALR